MLGFDPYRLNQLIGDGVDDPEAEWQGMPEYEYHPIADRTIHVHFKHAADADAFALAVGQKITEKTRSIWYPERPGISDES